MIRSKLIEFFYWLKDHFLVLVEVLVRLRIGTEKKEKPIGCDEDTSERKEDV